MDEKALAALRALQRYDQIVQDPCGRVLLIEAQTMLGESLGLACTGELEGGGFYDHSGGTCPIHEWYDPDDAVAVEQHRDASRCTATARYRGIEATVRISDYDDVSPGYLWVEVRMRPPMSGMDESVYNAHPKAPLPA